MFEIGAGMIFFQAFVIMGLLYVFARQEADYDYTKVVLVTCGIVTGNFLLAILLTPKLGLFVFLGLVAYTAFLLEKFCWVSWGRAIVITVLYFVLTLGFEVSRVRFITGEWRVPKTSPQPDTWKFPEQDQQMAEGLEVLKSINPAYTNHDRDADGTPRVWDDDGADTDEVAVAAAPMPVAPVLESAPPPGARPLDHSPTLRPPAPLPPPVAEVPPDRLDWPGARSMLRLRGTMKDVQGRAAAMVGTTIVSIGSEYSASWQGVRYTWRLQKLEGNHAEWQQVSAELVK